MVSLYDVSFGQFTRSFETFQLILEKGQEHCKANNVSPNELFNARLAPDMLPLPKQVQIASNVVKKSIERLTGQTLPVIEDNETTLEQLIARVKKTLEIIGQVKPEEINAKVSDVVDLKFGSRESKVSGKQYVFGYAIPNVYFHLVTAYGLLRMKGVNLGKLDYLQGFTKDF